MNIENAKTLAGHQAAEWIEQGMIVGLGTGSTAMHFIESLIQRCKKGLSIQAVASSKPSEDFARQGGISVLNINDVSHIDITVDGADEIDPKKWMIKGGGGAHTKEKILAAASKELIIIVDETKLVPSVGVAKLPVEILPYGSSFTRKSLEKMGYQGVWRQNKDASVFITENRNLIFDIHFKSPPSCPEKDHENILHIPGVVDTGFFFNYAGRVIVGYKDGRIKVF